MSRRAAKIKDGVARARRPRTGRDQSFVEGAAEPVWKSTSELGYLRTIAWTFVSLHAIEQT